MKKSIIITLILLLGLTSCNNFLDVESESKSGEEYVFGSTEEMSRVLTSVYASLLQDDAYGNLTMTSLALNSDVEFNAFTGSEANVNGSEFRRFDGKANGGDVRKHWTAMYQGIERANIFISGALASPVYNEEDGELQQMIGEARTLRAMLYHDLVVLYGDIPFSTTPAYELGDDLVIAVEDRNVILDFCLEDLKKAASKMKYASELNYGIRRASKEFAQGLIARVAMTRGGYSLYPDTGNPGGIGTMQRPSDYRTYYELARDYADSVILSGTHALNKSFRQVFIDECNYIAAVGDDPIFEIPFLQNASGNVGYVHGPTGEWSDNTTSGSNVWGRANPSSRLNAFYRYSFDREDLRLDYTVGLWYYQADGRVQPRSDYYVHNNKWSKFWTSSDLLNTSISPRSEGGTGIAYPYMRYAEVLLIYAEAVNELENGVSGTNGEKAKEAFRQVRERAFRSTESQAGKVDGYIADKSGSKEDFFQAIADERKWEFGGENMRWKDLARWNLYGKVLVETFMDYYMATMVKGGDASWEEGPFSALKWELLPFDLFWQRVDNPKDVTVYPNTTLQILDLYNPYGFVINPGTSWERSDFYNWWNDNESRPRDQIYYSFRGYIRDGEKSNYRELIAAYPDNLPPVRYILPYPEDAINRSNGKYKNYYGY